MKFVQDKEPVRWFRGRMFLRGHPVEIDDRATIEALSSHADFRKVDTAKVEKKAPQEMPVATPIRSRLGLPKKAKA